ncbi:glutathione S-transferase family protein [Zwartia panacis]|uniref:glutathione S-transferase family protein n=1 Tax=Zwartia panacis TaxID=2683345 RepID=UPI0025B4BF9F|nr:glutathione S-transferase family protein [Zwartia panacis]MDN4018420.1 glutathione S-transferase family protein [Zwartia panacis]
MFELHIANKNYSSWSLRPWLLMRALDIPFVEKLHYFSSPGTPSTFGTLSPSAKVPVLVSNGFHIWDTLSIVEYLAEEYPDVWPSEKVNRAWARSACAEMHSSFSALRNECSMSVGVRVRLHEMSAALKSDIARIESLWADGFDRFNGAWLAGDDFTAADAFFGPVAFRFRTYGILLTDRSQTYVEKLLNHPAMIEWEQAALNETVRDQSHDIEIENMGLIVQDLRTSPNFPI